MFLWRKVCVCVRLVLLLLRFFLYSSRYCCHNTVYMWVCARCSTVYFCWCHFKAMCLVYCSFWTIFIAFHALHSRLRFILSSSSFCPLKSISLVLSVFFHENSKRLRILLFRRLFRLHNHFVRYILLFSNSFSLPLALALCISVDPKYIPYYSLTACDRFVFVFVFVRLFFIPCVVVCFFYRFICHWSSCEKERFFSYTSFLFGNYAKKSRHFLVWLCYLNTT